MEKKIMSIPFKFESLRSESKLLKMNRLQMREKLAGFYESDAGKMTVMELLTSTSNVILPTMVQMQALLEWGIWSDLREVSMDAPVPQGSGKVVNTQILLAHDYAEWVEGSAINAADPNPTYRTITLKPFGQCSLLSDLLVNTSAVNFVEQIGKLHGTAVLKGIFQYVLNGLSGAGGGSLSAASGANLQFGDAVAGIKQVAKQSFQVDQIITSPDAMWNAFTTSYAVQQFTGALNNLLENGDIPKALGIEWYADPYFYTAQGRQGNKAIAYVGTKGLSTIWAALQQAPLVELFRLPTALSNYVITHVDGGASAGIADSMQMITSAT